MPGMPGECKWKNGKAALECGLSPLPGLSVRIDDGRMKFRVVFLFRPFERIDRIQMDRFPAIFAIESRDIFLSFVFHGFAAGYLIQVSALQQDWPQRELLFHCSVPPVSFSQRRYCWQRHLACCPSSRRPKRRCQHKPAFLCHWCTARLRCSLKNP